MSPGFNVARQLLVVEADAREIAEAVEARVEHEGRVGLEHDLAVDELADADLRTLQVAHDRDLATRVARGGAHAIRAQRVVLGLAVGEVEAEDVDAGRDQLGEDIGLGRGRADGGDDLGGAWHGVILCA